MSHTRAELVNQLQELINANRHAEDDEVKAAAAVLGALGMALCAGSTVRLMHLTARFSEGELRRLTAERN